MMKLNKDSITNNTSEQPDKGALAPGSDLFTLSSGRYYISDLSTMSNAPDTLEMSGSAILIVDITNENIVNERNLQLWNDLGGYATARTQNEIKVTGWNVFSTGGITPPPETLEGVNFIASSNDVINVSNDPSTPSYLTGLNLSIGSENFAIDPVIGAVQNRSGKTLKSVTGTINFQSQKTGGGTTTLFYYSESSPDKINWTVNSNSLRTVEVTNNSESFTTGESSVINWIDGYWVRFVLYEDGAGSISFESPNGLDSNANAITGFSVFWNLQESVGGGSGGGGEAPNKDIITLSGEDLSATHANLNTNFIGDKANEPILWGIYKTINGDFIETSINTSVEVGINNYAIRIHEYDDETDLFLSKEYGEVIIYKDFNNRTDKIRVPGLDSLTDASLSTFAGVLDNNCFINSGSLITKANFDFNLSTIQEIADSVTISSFNYNAEYGNSCNSLFITKKGLFMCSNSSTWETHVKLMDTGANFGVVNTFINYDISSVTNIGGGDFSYYTYITQNGFLFSYGTLYDIETLLVVETFGTYNHRSGFSCVNSNGKDILTLSSGSKNDIIIINENNTTEKIIGANTSSKSIISYINENNFLLGESGKPDNYFSNYTEKKSEGVYSTITTRKLWWNTSQSTRTAFKTRIQNQFTRPMVVSINETDDKIIYLMKSLLNISDIFTVQAEPTASSSDKHNWLLLQKL